jgi:hypothetical protein
VVARSHKIGGAELAEAVLEGREGGRCHERDVDGTECDWGKVLVWEPPTRLVLAWQISGERTEEMRKTFDGPNAWRGILESFAQAL